MRKWKKRSLHTGCGISATAVIAGRDILTSCLCKIIPFVIRSTNFEAERIILSRRIYQPRLMQPDDACRQRYSGRQRIVVVIVKVHRTKRYLHASLICNGVTKSRERTRNVVRNYAKNMQLYSQRLACCRRKQPLLVWVKTAGSYQRLSRRNRSHTLLE